MKTMGLKHDRRTGAKTVLMNRDIANCVFRFLAEIKQVTIMVLLRTLPKLVIKILTLLLIETVADPASAETGLFLMLQRCRIVRSEVVTELT